MKPKSITTGLDVAGLALIVYGTALFWLPLALIVAGGLCLAASRAIVRRGGP